MKTIAVSSRFSRPPTLILRLLTLITLLALLSLPHSTPVSAGANTWTPLGPQEGGSTKLILFDPLTPTTLYVATGDGVFKSINAGQNWFAASSGLPADPVSSLAVHPLAPETLYAGKLAFRLSTDQAAEGTYLIKVANTLSAYTTLRLGAAAPLHDLTGAGTIYAVPSGIALLLELFLPAVVR